MQNVTQNFSFRSSSLNLARMKCFLFFSKMTFLLLETVTQFISTKQKHKKKKSRLLLKLEQFFSLLEELLI